MAAKCITVDNRREQSSAVPYICALEHLRTVFGWNECKEPNVESGRWRALVKDRVRFYFYLEMPDHLRARKDLQKAWLVAVLKLRTGQDISFELEEDVLTFIPFMVDPHIVRKACYVGDVALPMVIPCGDAQASPDYRLGTGILHGIDRANVLFNSIQLTWPGLSINVKEYGFHLQHSLGMHVQQIKGEYDSIKRQCDASLEVVLPLYQNGQVIREIGISSRPLEICKHLGRQKFGQGKHDEAKQYFAQALDFCRFSNRFSETTEFDTDTAMLCSNLIIIALKQKEYTEGLVVADRVLREIPKTRMDARIYVKIIGNQIKCHIELALLENDIDILQSSVEMIERLYRELPVEEISEAERTGIDGKRRALETRLKGKTANLSALNM